MLAQFYNDSPKIIRIFDKYGACICDIPFTYKIGNKDFLDVHLSKVRMRRRTKWTKTSYGAESHVRFKS